jgi:hypothetical protein
MTKQEKAALFAKIVKAERRRLAKHAKAAKSETERVREAGQRQMRCVQELRTNVSETGGEVSRACSLLTRIADSIENPVHALAVMQVVHILREANTRMCDVSRRTYQIEAGREDTSSGIARTCRQDETNVRDERAHDATM